MSEAEARKILGEGPRKGTSSGCLLAELCYSSRWVARALAGASEKLCGGSGKSGSPPVQAETRTHVHMSGVRAASCGTCELDIALLTFVSQTISQSQPSRLVWMSVRRL